MTTRQKINRALDRLELLQVEIDKVVVALLQDIRDMTSEQPGIAENLGKP